MQLFGRALNFYGGIGECNHKKNVKDTAFNTQKRIQTFTSQIAQQYYEGMTLAITKECSDRRINEQLGDHSNHTSTNDTHPCVLGKYELTITGLTDHGQFDDHTVNKKGNLPLKFVWGVSYYAATDWDITGTFTVTGYSHTRSILKTVLSSFAQLLIMVMIGVVTIGA